MKEFWARLNPIERRFVVGVVVAFFLVGNIVWVWPHFADWGTTTSSMNNWVNKLAMFQAGADKVPHLNLEIQQYKQAGQSVPPQDTAVEFARLVRNQANASGVNILNMGSARQGGTNQFFVEQNETIQTQSGEKQLVDFLYNLGAGQSLIRVKVLSVQPDPSHQQLSARITLIASYQRTASAAKAAAGPASATPPAGPAANKPGAPATPKPAAPTQTGATPKPVPNPLTPRPGPLSPMGHIPATNKPNPLKPNKQ